MNEVIDDLEQLKDKYDIEKLKKYTYRSGLPTNGNEFYNAKHWREISQNTSISYKFIEKYKEQVDWNIVSHYQKLSEQFIGKMLPYVDMITISYSQKLSEDFIEQYWYSLDHTHISQYQTLSEDFIERHQDEVEWMLISECQKLSINFIKKHINKIDVECLFYNRNIKEEDLISHGIDVLARMKYDLHFS